MHDVLPPAKVLDWSVAQNPKFTWATFLPSPHGKLECSSGDGERGRLPSHCYQSVYKKNLLAYRSSQGKDVQNYLT